MDFLLSRFEKLSIPSSAPDDKWRLWLYECPDFPRHEHKRDQTEENCKYCAEIQKMVVQHKAQHKEKPIIYESYERWPDYMKEDLAYNNLDAMVDAVVENVQNGGQYSFGAMAKKIRFNHKLGFAFFRDGIFVDSTSAQNRQGGVFQLLLLANARETTLLTKFDGIFCKLFKLLKTFPRAVADCVHGIYVHSEVNPGMRLKGEEPYKDKADLPCMFKVEIWARNVRDEATLKKHLVSKINQICHSTLEKPQFRQIFNFKPNADKCHDAEKIAEQKEKKDIQKAQ